MHAALKQIDQNGIESVGVRQLASQLGVAPNSLYSYVHDKNDIIQGAVELAFGDLEIPRASGATWQESLVELCTWLRERLLQHPNLVSTTGFAEATPFPFVSFPTTIGVVLNEAGFEGEELIEVVFAVFYHTVGFVMMEVARAEHGVPTESDEFLVARLDPRRFGKQDLAEAAALVPLVRRLDLSASFRRSVHAMVDGLGEPASKTGKRRTRR